MLNRRESLRRATLLALAPSVPAFMRASLAAEEDVERILVVVQMSGGNDGLNTVVPFRNDGYLANRRKLRLDSKGLHQLNDETGLHANMRGMAELLEDGRLAIVQGVGYPKPNRSHDVSMSVWHTARLDAELHDSHGWLGRALDRLPISHAVPASLLVSNRATPQALVGRKCLSTTMDQLSDLEFEQPSPPLAANSEGPALEAFMQRATLDAYEAADRVREVADALNGSTDSQLSKLRSTLARRLSIVRDLITTQFGPKIYYVMQTGYDTHSEQLDTHARLLGDLSRALKAFLDDLRDAGCSKQVTVLCFSEFGRQVRENASAGTDHGTAGPVFVAGSAVRAGLHGRAPDLQDLKQNAPQFTTDFRAVYSSILRDWLGLKSAAILDGFDDSLELFA